MDVGEAWNKLRDCFFCEGMKHKRAMCNLAYHDLIDVVTPRRRVGRMEEDWDLPKRASWDWGRPTIIIINLPPFLWALTYLIFCLQCTFARRTNLNKLLFLLRLIFALMLIFSIFVRLRRSSDVSSILEDGNLSVVLGTIWSTMSI